jgi:hypothetical protein
MYLSACQGVSRPVVEEAQLHFASKDRALWWANRYAKIAPGNTRWTSDGLYVQWYVIRARGQLNVEVIQLCINGERPVGLDGSSDSSITVVGPSPTNAGRVSCAVIPETEVAQSESIWEQHFREAEHSR